jgi:hypothetical protein
MMDFRSRPMLQPIAGDEIDIGGSAIVLNIAES